MNCARCGNAIHRVPMFDLPRKVKEYSCLCCGERFWTTQGESSVFRDLEQAKAAAKTLPALRPIHDLPSVAHRN